MNMYAIKNTNIGCFKNTTFQEQVGEKMMLLEW